MEADTVGLWERKDNGTFYPAGFWIRLWAYIIDLIIVSSISGIILTPIYAFTNISDLTLGIYTIGGILGAFVSFSYFIFLTKYFGQTLGKRILGIRVLSEKNETLSWADVIMRELFGRYIHQSLVFTNLIYLLVAFHHKKKGLHDYFADTYVVLEPREVKSQ
ncbi:RDD family protein [Bacillus alkalicola]|uniref:RDD family protein n=2 Tax=Bacillales TaxID=1385 RepID=A0ABS6JRC8_9BACI|nr:RDD family protein [Bacillus alkalicola]